MNLKDDLPILKKTITELNEKQIVEEIELIDVEKAFINSHCMILKNTEDYFLFFASLNLLNAYIKKDNAIEKIKNNYNFKKEISKGIELLINFNNSEIKFSYDKNLAVVDILGLQFSFHNVGITELMSINKEKYEPIIWQGIRLQPVASTIFSFANKLTGLSKTTILNNNLDQLYDEINIDSIR